jgi:hypothetical protein
MAESEAILLLRFQARVIDGARAVDGHRQVTMEVGE